MSTRAQCFIKDSGIFLYQHCDGDSLMDTVVKAVNGPVGKCRQNDPEYLARIIFCEMVKGNEDGETGYGIGKSIHGDIVYLVTVDCKKRTITETNDVSDVLRVVDFE